MFTESLILAQNERWQRGLGMQVEREFVLPQGRMEDSGGRVSNARVICPQVGDSSAKAELIPNVVVLHMKDYPKPGTARPGA